MEYTKLGLTDIAIPRLCIGGMSFGKPMEERHLWTEGEERTREVIAHALDLGINFIDTANMYSMGTSEIYIGRALKALRVPRDKVVIASKVYFNEGHLSREAILREIEGTLGRLGTDYLDIYYIHRFDYGTPVEETMETLDSLVRAGKVRALGASAMYGFQFHNMQIAAEKNGWTPFSAMQNHYNLNYREDERDLIPVCRQYGVSLIPYSPLEGGHLCRPTWRSGSLRSETDAKVREKYDHAMEEDLRVIARVEEVARERGVPMAPIALAWLFAKGVASPIIGAGKTSYVDDAVKALDIRLTDDEIARLEELYVPHKVVGALPIPA